MCVCKDSAFTRLQMTAGDTNTEASVASEMGRADQHTVELEGGGGTQGGGRAQVGGQHRPLHRFRIRQRVR